MKIFIIVLFVLSALFLLSGINTAFIKKVNFEHTNLAGQEIPYKIGAFVPFLFCFFLALYLKNKSKKSEEETETEETD